MTDESPLDPPADYDGTPENSEGTVPADTLTDLQRKANGLAMEVADAQDARDAVPADTETGRPEDCTACGGKGYAKVPNYPITRFSCRDCDGTGKAVPADTLAEWLRSFARDVGRPTIDGYEVRYLNRCADEIEQLADALMREANEVNDLSHEITTVRAAAKTEIVRLQAEVERLRAALKEIDNLFGVPASASEVFRIARRALEGET